MSLQSAPHKSFNNASNESRNREGRLLHVQGIPQPASSSVSSIPLSALRRSGSRYNGLCPFHHDKNPSLVIFPSTGTYFCFACEAKGRAISDGFSYNLYPWGTRDIPYTRQLPRAPKPIDPPPLTEDSKDVLSSASLIYYATLYEAEGSSALTYLTVERGLDPSILAQYAIGYANGKTLPSTSPYYNLGLVRGNGEDFFSFCILFPNFDLKDLGKVSYITGRGFPDKKHLRPPSSRIKRTSLYLEAFARQYKKIAIIDEGEGDTLTLRQAGLNAMGLYGIHSFDESDAKRLRDAFDIIIPALDGDEAGRNASRKIAQLIGPKARVLFFPEGFTKADGTPIKDWNELFVHHFNKDIPAFRVYVQRLIDELVSGWDYLEERGTLSQTLGRVRDERKYGKEMASKQRFEPNLNEFTAGKIAKEIEQEEGEGEEYAIEQATIEVKEKERRQQRQPKERKEVKRRKNKGDLIEKHYEFKHGYRWGAYRDYVEDACKYYVFTCMSKGTLHDCHPSDHAPWEKHSIFKRCACGDKDHCVLCGDTYSGERARDVIDPIIAIAKKWEETAPHQPVYAGRMVVTLPMQIWHKVDYQGFGKFEDAVSDALKEYYKGASCPHYINRHYWHSRKPVVTGSLLGGVAAAVVDYAMAKWWQPHLHICLVNVLKKDNEFIWTTPYLDEERLKIVLGKNIAKKFDIPYVIERKKVLKKGRNGKKKTYKEIDRFYYILDGKRVAINLRISGYIEVNDKKFIIKRGKNKGEEAPFTNIEYLRGRLRYDCRQPNLDIAEYADANGINKFTEDEKKIVSDIIDGPPKYWRRGKWRGWLADSVKAKNLARLGIYIESKKERKEKFKKEPLICPVHNKPTTLQFEGFEPKKVFPKELSSGDIMLSIRYNLNGRYWVIKKNLNGREITPQDIEMHVALFIASPQAYRALLLKQEVSQAPKA